MKMGTKKTFSKKLVFTDRAGVAMDSFVLVFDLEGFSNFFSQPDIQEYISRYLNRIFDAVSRCIYGGEHYWMDKNKYGAMPSFRGPTHIKFLGDGALYIWTFKTGERDSIKNDILYFINRCWNMKDNFKKIADKCSEDVPVVDLPKRIRFGFASGSVNKLIYTHSKETEYVGYCINLASRLQSYCRSLGFIASARISFPVKDLKKHRYKKVVAKKLLGFPKEVVIVDSVEYKNLPPETKEDLFEEIDSES
jgi:class 3 adenylate cyclase